MKGLNKVWIELFKICGLAFVFLVIVSGRQPMLYKHNEVDTKVHLYDDSLIIIDYDGDTIAAASIEWYKNEWARLYSYALITRFSEGMTVESDTCYSDSCEIVFDFPNLNCNIIASLYYKQNNIYYEDSIPKATYSADNALSELGYLKKTAFLLSGNNTASFTLPRKTCHFLITLDGIQINPSSMAGQYWGLLQNPCYFMLLTPFELEPENYFSTDGQNKRFTYPNVDTSLFRLWYFDGDFVRITSESITWKSWTWYRVDD